MQEERKKKQAEEERRKKEEKKEIKSPERLKKWDDLVLASSGK